MHCFAFFTLSFTGSENLLVRHLSGPKLAGLVRFNLYLYILHTACTAGHSLHQLSTGDHNDFGTFRQYRSLQRCRAALMLPRNVRVLLAHTVARFSPPLSIHPSHQTGCSSNHSNHAATILFYYSMRTYPLLSKVKEKM